MAAVSAVAEVSSIGLRGHLEASGPDNPAAALAQFAASRHPTLNETTSAKRRKLNNGHKAEAQLDLRDSLILAKVTLELHVSAATSSAELPPSSDQPVEVSLETFVQEIFNEFRITLWTRSNPPSGIDLVATSSSLASLAPHLTKAVNCCNTRNGKERSAKMGAAFARCTLFSPCENMEMYRLQTEIRWRLGYPVTQMLAPGSRLAHSDMELFDHYFPKADKEKDEQWSLSDFYDSVHVPAKNSPIPREISQQLLANTQLYPFQQRAVDWLLRREGVRFREGTGKLFPAESSPEETEASYQVVEDAEGKTFFVNHLLGLALSAVDPGLDPNQILRGGILADEMGLGKTVELVALMSYHKRPVTEQVIHDSYLGANVKSSAATLIITPPSILEQWKNEIATHAPELTVLHYQGLPPASAPRKDHDATTVENLLKYDVVLTTYQVLSREVHFAKPPPERSFRHKKQHEPRKSPLVQISWWRVCLDEAQMVESGVSQAATVARIIPRCNAWAVSGTPLRKNILDLRGLLTFLRYEPFASCKAVWDRLDKSSFRAIFNKIALRHTKKSIRDELQIPPQKRIVLNVPFTAIEEQNYSEMVRQMCDACGLSPEGAPMQEGQSPDDPEVIESMREWLVRLRQTCLHAHVGSKNRKALRGANGPLRTVDEVLEVMIDQNDAALKSEAREYIQTQLVCGHIRANAKDDQTRSEHALKDYMQALEHAQGYVQTSRDELKVEREMRKNAAKPKGDGESDDGDNSDDEADSPGRVAVVRKAVRSFLEMEHACSFFIATSYYQTKDNADLTSPDSERFQELEKLETDWYEKAKTIRAELLQDAKAGAERTMKKVRIRKSSSPIPQIEQLDDLGGIESRKTLDMMDRLTEILNAQATQLEEWRQKVTEILLKPLVDEDEKDEKGEKAITGDEYEDSTKLQDELYVYIQALRTLIADRNAATNGLQDFLVDYEFKAAERQASEGEGHAPELFSKVAELRRKLKPKAEDGSLKGVVAAIRSLVTTLRWRAEAGENRAAAELSIAEKQFVAIQEIAAAQAKGVADLEKQQELFRASMNARLEYYRQLQNISDSVAPWREELDEQFDQAEFLRQTEKSQRQAVSLANLKKKQTYLANLRRKHAEEERPSCVICWNDIELGVLTSCGHAFCKDCLRHWWNEKHKCPNCRKVIRADDFLDITFGPSAIKARQEHQEDQEQSGPSQPSTPSSAGTTIYTDLDDDILKEIKSIDLAGSYGSKVDMIARHLLWIRHNDPGSKSIVFSQFGDFLGVLGTALKKWKIGVSSISERRGIERFKSDPAIECFLLDAKSDSSGLNLVNATYVFLCEPLINPAIELQAIARVHRIGQKRPTTVLQYLISDTVEEAIYDISVSRRLEHMSSNKNSIMGSRSGTATPALQESVLDAANSMEIDAAPVKQLIGKKGDGEVVQQDDLWKCLFGKPRSQQRALLDKEVGRHLRAEAAESRMAEAQAENACASH